MRPLSALAYLSATASVTGSVLYLPEGRPVSAKWLPPTLAGLSLEGDRWPDWAGNLTHPNEFTYTLLDNIRARTGHPPPIRVGGHSEDAFILDPSVQISSSVFPAVPSNWTSTKQLFPEASYIGVGRDFYLLSGNFPEGTSFTWGANLGANNASEVVAQVKAIKAAFKDKRLAKVTLDYVEVGNEPDGFGIANKHRPANYTPYDYARDYVDMISAVTSQLDEHDVSYQLGSLAAWWRSTELLGTGVLSSSVASRFGSVSEHHYQGIWLTRDPTGPELILKFGVRGNITQYAIGAELAHQAGLKFYLGETNSGFGHGIAGVSNAAAAALWMIDYTLQAAVVGVDGLHFHAGVGYNYSIFQPIDGLGKNITDYDPAAKRHIQPLYYGFVAVADAIGSSGKSCVSELYTDSSDLAAYAVWEEDELSRIMLINSVPWTARRVPVSGLASDLQGQKLTCSASVHSNASGSRPSMSITIPTPVKKDVRIKRLSVPGIDALSGVTWGGQSWETYSGKANGAETFDKLENNGTFLMEASSAALLYL